MIGNSTYIRSFTPEQRCQLEAVATEQKLNTVPDIIFFCLEKYQEHIQDIARLNRIIQYKQKKIERLEEIEKEFLKLIDETAGAGHHLYNNGKFWTLRIIKTDMHYKGTLNEVLTAASDEIKNNRDIRTNINTYKEYLYGG